MALDLNGAFNAALPGEFFKQLRDLGLPGRLINFVSFLTAKRNLFFSAIDGSPRVCGVGVPQGGVLSPILFNLHLRRLNEHLPPDVRAAMYADDLLLYVRGSDAVRELGLLESAVDSLTPWLGSLGLSISLPKSQLCVFSRVRRGFGDVSIRIGDLSISCQPSLKYLGVIMDARFTLVPHIKYIADQAIRAINVLRVIARVSWGANPALLLTVYRNLFRAYLEWGAPLFRCASKSALRILDRVQFGALRAALGGMRSTPTSVLLSEAGEPPPFLRRSLLSSRFFLRNFSWWGNPLLPRLQLLSERIAAGRLRLLPSKCGLLASYLGVPGLVEGRHRSRRASFSDVPWSELTLAVDVTVYRAFVTEPPDASGVQGSSLVPCPGLPRGHIYTDGSVDPVAGRAGCGFFVPSLDYRFGVRLPDASSVLFTELYAIFSAVKYILRVGLEDSVVLSDSRSALVGIRDRFTDSGVPYVVHSTARLLCLASVRGLVVRFAWIPAHSGIWGNETADCIARSAAGLPFSIFLPSS